MKNRSWPVFVSGVGFALLVNLVLFALIPYFASIDLPRQLPFRSQPVQFFQQPLPNPVIEEPQPVVEKDPPPPQPLQQPVTPVRPRLVFEPELDFSLPQASLQMTSGFDAAPLAPLTELYHPQDLDSAPRLSYRVPPVYPYRAKRMNISGHVKIQFDVTSDGSVAKVIVLESTPEGVFDDAVLKAVHQWRFHPGELMGDKVVTRMTRTIVFELEE